MKKIVRDSANLMRRKMFLSNPRLLDNNPRLLDKSIKIDSVYDMSIRTGFLKSISRLSRIKGNVPEISPCIKALETWSVRFNNTLKGSVSVSAEFYEKMFLAVKNIRARILLIASDISRGNKTPTKVNDELNKVASILKILSKTIFGYWQGMIN